VAVVSVARASNRALYLNILKTSEHIDGNSSGNVADLFGVDDWEIFGRSGYPLPPRYFLGKVFKKLWLGVDLWKSYPVLKGLGVKYCIDWGCPARMAGGFAWHPWS
jgi:hypothetical protein